MHESLSQGDSCYRLIPEKILPGSKHLMTVPNSGDPLETVHLERGDISSINIVQRNKKFFKLRHVYQLDEPKFFEFSNVFKDSLVGWWAHISRLCDSSSQRMRT